MNRAALLLLALIALAAGVYVWLGDDGEPSPVDRDPEIVEGPENPVGPTGSGPAGTTGGGTRTMVDDSITGGQGEPAAYRRALAGLRGRVVWAGSRKPVKHTEIRLIEAWLDAVVPTLEDLVGVEKMRSPVAFRAQTRTDEDGVFVLRGVHGRAMMMLAIGLKTAAAAVRPVAHTPAPGELVDLGEIELLERGTVTGRVVDEAGSGVPGARVRIADIPAMAMQFGVERFDPKGMGLIVQGPYRVVLEMPPWLAEYDEFLPFGDGRTDADGRFTIHGVRPGKPTIVVTKRGMTPHVGSVGVIAEQVSDAGDLSIQEGEFVSGRFVDSEDKPVAGVRVTAGAMLAVLPFGLLGEPMTVSADGKFEISGLPRGSLYICYQRRPRDAWEVHGPVKSDADVKLVLASRRDGTVTIKTTNGQPVPELKFDAFVADVSAYLPGFETHIPGDRHFFRDAERPDTWHVKDLPAGVYKIIAKADGFAFGTGALDLTRKTLAERHETIELHPAPRQRFEARDEKGRPIEAARVYWNPTPGRKMETSGRRRLTRLPVLLGKTDERGDLDVDAVEAGAVRFYCRHPGYALAVSNEAAGQGRPIRFVLGATGRVAGQVAENGRKPDQSWTVLAEPTSQLRRRFAGVLTPRLATTLPDGSFTFPSIQPGKWRLKAIRDFAKMRGPKDWQRMHSSRGGDAPQAEVEVHASLESHVLLETRPVVPDGAGSIVGSVRVGGKPAVGAWVQTWGGKNRADVGEDGNFALTGLADGDHWIGVEREGHEGMLPNRLFEGRVKITNGERAVLHIDVQVGDVVVTVVDEDGKPVSGLPIEVFGEASLGTGHKGSVRVAKTTDGSGEASFASVPSGTVRVRSMMERDPTLVIPEQRVEVFAGRPTTVRIVAGAAATARGEIAWDESGLADELEREFVRKRRPGYLVFTSEGRFTWGPVTTKAGASTFSTRKCAPGTYRLRPTGELRWTSSPLIIPAGGTANTRLTLRPDLSIVKASVAKLRPKPKGEPRKKDAPKR